MSNRDATAPPEFLRMSTTPTRPAATQRPSCTTTSQSAVSVSSTGLVRTNDPVVTRINTRRTNPRRRILLPVPSGLNILHRPEFSRPSDELEKNPLLIIPNEAARKQCRYADTHRDRYRAVVDDGAFASNCINDSE